MSKGRKEAISAILTEAEAAVAGSAVTDPELKAVAFAKAIDFIVATGQGDVASPKGSTPGPVDKEADGAADAFDRIAVKLGIDRDDAKELFHYDPKEKQFGLAIASTKFSSEKKKGTREIALLLVAGRQAAGVDTDWTPIKFVREEAEQYSRFDSSNFAFTISSMEDVFSFKGRGLNRELQLRRPGYESASTRAKKVLGKE